MKLSEKLSKTALQADDLLTSLDASVDAVEKLEAQNEKLQRELNTANERIIELLNIVAKGIKEEPQALRHIRTRAQVMAERLQRPESVIWACYLEACVNCVINIDNDVNPEPHES